MCDGVCYCVWRACGGVWYGVMIFMWVMVEFMVCDGVLWSDGVLECVYGVCYGVIAMCVTARKLLLITASVR